MEKSMNVLRLPFPFIRNPYLPGSALRMDQFQRQFTIVCTGVLSLPEDKAHVGWRRRVKDVADVQPKPK